MSQVAGVPFDPRILEGFDLSQLSPDSLDTECSFSKNLRVLELDPSQTYSQSDLQTLFRLTQLYYSRLEEDYYDMQDAYEESRRNPPPSASPSSSSATARRAQRLEEDLEHAVASHNRSLAELREEQRKLRSKLSESESRVVDLRSENRRLLTENELLNESSVRQKDRERGYDDLEAQMEDQLRLLEDERDTLLRELEDQKDELVRLREGLEAEVAEKEVLRTRLDGCMTELDSVSDAREKIERGFEKKLSDQKTEFDAKELEWQKRISQARTDVGDDVIRLQDEIETLSVQITEKDEQITKLKAENEANVKKLTSRKQEGQGQPKRAGDGHDPDDADSDIDFPEGSYHPIPTSSEMSRTQEEARLANLRADRVLEENKHLQTQLREAEEKLTSGDGFATAAAVEKLEAELATAASAAEEAARNSENAKAAVQRLNAEKEELQRILVQYDENVPYYQNQIVLLEGQVKKRDDDIARMKAELAAMSERLARFQFQLEIIMERYDIPLSALTDRDILGDAMGSREKMLEREQLRQRVQELTESLARVQPDLDTAMRERDEMAQRLGRALAKLAAAQSAGPEIVVQETMRPRPPTRDVCIGEFPVIVPTKVNPQLEKLMADVQSKTREIVDLKGIVADRGFEKDLLEKRLDQISRENADAVSRMSRKLETLNATLESEKSRFRVTMKNLRSELQNVSLELVSSQEEVRSLNLSLSRLNEVEEAKAGLAAQVKNLQGQISNLKANLVVTRKALSESEDQSNRITHLEVENGRLKRDISLWRDAATHSNLKHAMGEMMSGFDELLEEKDQMLGDLQSQVESLRETLVREGRKHRSEIDLLNHQVQEKEREIQDELGKNRDVLEIEREIKVEGEGIPPEIFSDMMAQKAQLIHSMENRLEILQARVTEVEAEKEQMVVNFAFVKERLEDELELERERAQKAIDIERELRSTRHELHLAKTAQVSLPPPSPKGDDPSELKRAQEYNEKLNAIIEEMKRQAHLREMETVQAQDDLNREIMQLKKRQQDILMKRIRNLTDVVSRLKSEKEEMLNTIHTLREREQKSEDQRMKLARTLTEYRTRERDLKSELERFEQDNLAVANAMGLESRRKIEMLEKKVRILKGKLGARTAIGEAVDSAQAKGEEIEAYLRQQMAALTEKLASLQQDNVSLRLRLQEIDVGSSPIQAPTSRDSGSALVAQLRRRIQSLESELESLQASAPFSAPDGGADGSNDEELDRLREELLSVKEEAQNKLNRAVRRSANSRIEADLWKRRFKSFQIQLRQATDGEDEPPPSSPSVRTNSDLDRLIEAWESENSLLLQEVKKKNLDLQAEQGELMVRLELCKRKLQTANSRISKSRQTTPSATPRASPAPPLGRRVNRAELEEKQRIIDALNMIVSKLRDENETIRKKQVSSRKFMAMLKENRSLKADQETLQEEVSDLKKRLAMSADDQNKQRRLLRTCQRQKQTIRSLRQDFEGAQVDIRENANDKATLEEDIQNLQDQVMKLQEAGRCRVEMMENDAIRQLKGELDKAHSRIEELVADVQTHKNDASVVRRDQVKRAARQEGFRKQLEQLEGVLSALQTAKARGDASIKRLEAETSQLKGENETLKESNKQLRTTVAQFEEIIPHIEEMRDERSVAIENWKGCYRRLQKLSLLTDDEEASYSDFMRELDDADVDDDDEEFSEEEDGEL